MMQGFQMVGGRDAQGIENARGMKHFQLDSRRALDILGQLGRKSSVKKLLGFLAFEGLDHGLIVSIKDNIVNGYYVQVVLGSYPHLRHKSPLDICSIPVTMLAEGKTYKSMEHQ